MTKTFKVALIQTTTGRDPLKNLEALVPQITKAAGQGADFIMLPETVGMMEPDRDLAFAKAQPQSQCDILSALQSVAADLNVWVLIGSLVVLSESTDKLANRSFLIDDKGEIRAQYDKIHLFDVKLSSGEFYRESKNYHPGDTLVQCDTPWGNLGMSICYDLRFPDLYRTLAKNGASFLSIPAAFTRPTGQAHWHTLLRARAIETGCFVFAPAQCGKHEGGRQTYGHSLIIDPWGEVLADGGDEPGIIVIDIDPSRVEAVRAQIPSLSHDRGYS